jgi:hypothetical protein
MLALFAGVLIMGFLVGPANVAVGQTGAESIADDAGTLLLELGATDQFRYVGPPDAPGVALQGISDTACKVSLTGTTLMSLTALPAKGSAGLFDDGIGVQVKGGGAGGNGQPCGRADGPSEGLVFALAGELIGEKEISRAEIDLEGKFGVTVEATLKLDGAVVASPTAGCDTDGVNGDDLPRGNDCVKATGELSDSGPDSTDGDNYRWIIDPGADMVADVLFDEIVFTVSPSTPDGAFSIEGGADGTMAGPLGAAFDGGMGTEATLFNLVDVDGILDCNESATTGNGETEPLATFTRGQDNTAVGKNGEPCTALIAYNLTSEAEGADQSVTFEFDTGEYPTWFGTFVWTPEEASMPVEPTTVDGDVLDWCAGFTGLQDEWGNDIPIMPGGADWCLIDQHTELLGDGLIQVTQTIYGETDPNFARPK